LVRDINAFAEIIRADMQMESQKFRQAKGMQSFAELAGMRGKF
jgi:hypothetical protein